MCISIIKKIFKGSSNKTHYGYKIAYKIGNKYQPLFCCQWERWEIGSYYTASDQDCYPYNKNQSDLKERFKHLLGRNLYLKLIRSENGRYYESGYHYFSTLKEAAKAYQKMGFESSGKRILYCEFKERLATGYQHGLQCWVAKKMMPMEELTIEEVKYTIQMEES